MSSAPAVQLRRHGDHVVEIVLDRPDALNAISTALAREFAASCELCDDHTVRAVVVSSSNARAFCAGADLKERAEFSDAELLDQRPVLVAMFAALRGLPVPVVAAVTGFALGGGCEVALSCDLIVADSSAIFGLPEVGVGLVPGGGGTQLLARRIGLGRACDLVLSGRKVDAYEAYRLGIVDRIVEEGVARTAALQAAASIAANSPVAVRHAKRALHDGFGRPLAEALSIEDAAWRSAALSTDRVEGIAAFTEKRRPQWPQPQ